MSKKKIIKKTTKRPVKKSLKLDPKFMTPIVPESFIKQYEKDLEIKKRQKTIQDAKAEKIFKEILKEAEDQGIDTEEFKEFKKLVEKGNFTKKIKESLVRQGIATTPEQIVSERQQEEAGKTKVPVEVINTILGRKDGESSFSVESDSKFWDTEKVNVMKIVADNLTQEEIAPSRPMKEVFAKNRARLNADDMRTLEEREAKRRLDLGIDKSTDSIYEAACKVDAVNKHPELAKATIFVEQFEKALGEKTAAYYKAKRDLFVFKKAYDSALEEVFGKV